LFYLLFPGLIVIIEIVIVRVVLPFANQIGGIGVLADGVQGGVAVLGR